MRRTLLICPTYSKVTIDVDQIKTENPPIYIIHGSDFFDLTAYSRIIPREAHMKKTIAPLIVGLLIALVCSGAMADWSIKGWKRHHTKLFDARHACQNPDSLECEPFLAAAVAVAEVFSEIAKPDEKGDLIVTFPDAV